MWFLDLMALQGSVPNQGLESHCGCHSRRKWYGRSAWRGGEIYLGKHFLLFENPLLTDLYENNVAITKSYERNIHTASLVIYTAAVKEKGIDKK
jgi:hypothetical protein